MALRILPLVVLICFAIDAFPQKLQLINSGEVLENGKLLYDSGKYTEAMAEYSRIVERDTNYVKALYEMALTHVAKKNYDSALLLCDIGLQKDQPLEVDFLRLQAIATDRKGEVGKSIAMFKKASEKFPSDFSLIYNLGITYYNSKAYEDAVNSFFKVLYINPYHAGSHLNLGRLSIGQGRRTHAMLALGIYLAIANTDNANLVQLNKFLDNQSPDDGTLKSFGTNDAEKLDQIIKARIAMEESYKTKVPINAAVVRQFQMLFDQLSTINPSKDDPWINYYLSIYKSMNDAQMSEAFTYHILGSATSDVVKKWAAKNDKTLQNFYDLVNVQLKKNRAVLDPRNYGFTAFGFDRPIAAWYDNNNRLDAAGEKSGDLRTGHWVFFHDTGHRSGEGDYNDKGTKTGAWKYYTEDGSVSSTENYTSGEIKTFRPDATLEKHYVMKNEKPEGVVNIFYACGKLDETLNYKDGVRQGKGTTHYPSGDKKIEYYYVNDKLNGEYLTYFPHGQISKRQTYQAGILTGRYEEFHANGKTEVQGELKNDQEEGKWSYYYSNGKLDHAGLYVGGKPTGEWVYYNEDGELIEKRIFDNAGLRHGDDIFYSEGKPYNIITYRKGLLVGTTSLDKTGKELFKAAKSDGTMSIKTFSPAGILLSEGGYSKGMQHGTWRYYYPNGKLLSVFTYEHGQAQAEATEYYVSGKTKIVANYKDGERHGYYREYFEHGQIKLEGWYQLDKRQQQWLSYYADGSLEEDNYYLDDQYFGKNYSYASDGKVSNISTYDKNGFVEISYFDAKGKTLSTDNIYATTQTSDKYASGKPRLTYMMECGEFSGAMERLYPDGMLYFKYNFMNGLKNGQYLSRFMNGKPVAEGYYANGVETGTWKYYYPEGSLQRVVRYTEGETDSVKTYYHPHGAVSSRSLYKNDKRDGVSQYFSPHGTLLMEKRYEKDVLMAYRTLNATGALGEWINFSGNARIIVKYTNGNTALDEEYVNGMRQGVSRDYFENGTLYQEFNFDQGLYQGHFEQHHLNGKLKESAEYKADELEGKWELFDDEGKAQATGNYSMGYRDGKFTWFEKGVPVKFVTYWNAAPEE